MAALDLIVIGGGSGGIATARRAAKHGAKVLLIEGGAIGGTCVNVGCVPKKVMWNAAMIHNAQAMAAAYGFAVGGESSFDYGRLKRGRDAYIRRLNESYDRNLAKGNVERRAGWAKFVDAHTVEVGGERLKAPHIVIATGGRPVLPQRPGCDRLDTSDSFFTWEQLPTKVAVIGSGYIAVELAGVMHALGTEVHLFIRKDRILRTFDQELGEHLLTQMRRDGIVLHTDFVLSAVEQTANGDYSVRSERGSISGFAKVLAAIGRRPNTDLDLAAAGIRCAASGHIEVDAYQNTSQAGVYAIGDVTGKVELTPVAIAAGRLLAERLFNGKAAAKLDYEQIATVVFSHPPLATVGLSEEAARQRYGDAEVLVHRSSFVNMLHALSEDKPKTLMKIVTRRSDDRVLGMHVIGTGADEMIQGFAVALRLGTRKSDLDATVAVHPTAAEEFVTM